MGSGCNIVFASMLFMPRSHKTLCFLSASATCLLKRLFWLDNILGTGHNAVLLAKKFLANSEFMNNFYLWPFAIWFVFKFNILTSIALRQSCLFVLSHYCILLSKLFPKMFTPLYFPFTAFVYISWIQHNQKCTS